jgi:hypothetical protein
MYQFVLPKSEGTICVKRSKPQGFTSSPHHAATSMTGGCIKHTRSLQDRGGGFPCRRKIRHSTNFPPRATCPPHAWKPDSRMEAATAATAPRAGRHSSPENHRPDPRAQSDLSISQRFLWFGGSRPRIDKHSAGVNSALIRAVCGCRVSRVIRTAPGMRDKLASNIPATGSCQSPGLLLLKCIRKKACSKR